MWLRSLQPSLLPRPPPQIEYPLSHPELFAHLGVPPPTGVLLHGPAGCGKSMLARCIAGELGVYFRSISALPPQQAHGC